MSRGSTAPAWAGLAVGAAVLAVAAVLLHRVLTLLLEIRRYADEIAVAGENIGRNTDAGGELTRLRTGTAALRAALARSSSSGEVR